jgi:hypothetical protein
MARFHNPGGLGNPGRRKAYLKEVLRGIQILGVCELAVESEAELEKELRWEHACEVVMGGYRGRNTGLALIVKMSVDGRHLTKRRDGAQHGMQILIVDIEIKGYKFRFVLTHAPPQTDLVLKTEYYTTLAEELEAVEAEDRATAFLGNMAGGGSATYERPYTIWMGDHNMVEHAIDEEVSLTSPKYVELRTALRRVRTILGTEDTFRRLRGAAQAYTHGKKNGRRIDRIESTAGMHKAEGDLALPSVAHIIHVEQEDIAIVTLGKRDTVHRPGHKAVDIMVRFSHTIREKRP